MIRLLADIWDCRSSFADDRGICKNTQKKDNDNSDYSFHDDKGIEYKER